MAVSVPGFIKKYLTMKPEVTQIFNDLEEYLNYCRYNMLRYDPKDMYKSEQYKTFLFGKGKKVGKQRR